MLYVECYPDEVLVRILGVPCREIRHEGGKGNITNRLRRLDRGMGLVDEDAPGFQPAELRNYRLVKNTGNLFLMEHKENPAKQLVLVRPRLEQWLYGRAAAWKVCPRKYGLPDTAKQLKAIPRYERKSGFVKFLKCLHQIDDEMKCLHQWIVAHGVAPGNTAA